MKSKSVASVVVSTASLVISMFIVTTGTSSAQENRPPLVIDVTGKQPGIVVNADTVDVVRPGATTVKSPLLVRGGAMTFYTSDQWNGPTTGPYCTSVDISEVAIEGFTSDQTGSKAIQDGVLLNLPISWTIQIFGHDDTDPKGGKPGSNGIQLQGNPAKDCNAQAGSSVKMTVLGDASKAIFYDNPLPPRGKYTDNKRFHDTSCKKDTDYCERIAQVKIFITDSSLTTPDITLYCKDGECSIRVGQ